MLFKKSCRIEKAMDQMKREQEVPNLEPVKHLSSPLQRKLNKREYRQRKRFRSSGKPYPLTLDMDKNGNEEELSVPASGPSLTTGQRLALAITSLVMVMLLTFVLVGIVATMQDRKSVV